MIYAYRCKKCNYLQEVWHKMNEENIEHCKECNAKPEEMKKEINYAPKHGHHISWSKWRAGMSS